MIKPTDKDIGRKVVWYPSLEGQTDFYVKKWGDGAVFGTLIAPKILHLPKEAVIDIPGSSHLWANHAALDWADDL